MNKLLLTLAVAAALYVGFGQRNTPPPSNPPANEANGQRSQPSSPDAEVIAAAFAARRSGVQVSSEGRVSQVLKDDNQGSRHQRFLLAMPDGQTLLVAHNIDLAPRVNGLAAGDTVAFNGVYEWNAQGGVIHWTHRDPQGRHAPGWLRVGGQTYQ